MGSTRRIGCVILLIILFGLPASAKVLVRVMNQLGGKKVLDVHCQSGDNDLGLVTVPDGFELDWSFSVNIWGTTLFYCDVRWDNSTVWHHFDAYSYDKDSVRCRTQCIWMVTGDGLLLNYNQEYGYWDLIPFKDS